MTSGFEPITSWWWSSALTTKPWRLAYTLQLVIFILMMGYKCWSECQNFMKSKSLHWILTKWQHLWWNCWSEHQSAKKTKLKINVLFWCTCFQGSDQQNLIVILWKKWILMFLNLMLRTSLTKTTNSKVFRQSLRTIRFRKFVTLNFTLFDLCYTLKKFTNKSRQIIIGFTFYPKSILSQMKINFKDHF
jgi:hypothetical protein